MTPVPVAFAEFSHCTKLQGYLELLWYMVIFTLSPQTSLDSFRTVHVNQHALSMIVLYSKEPKAVLTSKLTP